MVAEPLIAEQLEILSRANKALFGIASLRPNASLYSDGVFDAADAAELHRRRRRRRAGGAFHRRLGTAGRRDARRSRDRPVARRPAAHRSAHLRGGRIRQSAGDSRRASPRLRQCARHRRRHRARRAARRRRRRDRAAPGDRQVDQGARRANRGATSRSSSTSPTSVVEEMLDGAIRAHRAFLRPLASSRRALVALDGPASGQGRPGRRRRVGPRAVLSRLRRQGPRRRRRGRQHLLDAAARSDLSLRAGGLGRRRRSPRLRQLCRRRDEFRHGGRDRRATTASRRGRS